jgi:hypothetical protein
MVETLAIVDGFTRGRAFYAGIVLWSRGDTSGDDDVVVETAPVCRRFKGWTRRQVRSYVGQQYPRWTVSVVHQTERERPPWWKPTPTSRAR